MYGHLNRLTSRTGATNTHTKAQRKENLPFSAGEPSPALSSSALAGPPQAACGASRPRLPPTGHERGNERGGRERESSRADEPSRGESIRDEKRAKRAKRAETARPTRVRPLWSGAPPFALPRLTPPPFWELPKRGVPHSRQRHTARPPIGGEPPHPVCHTPWRKQAGKIRAPLGTPVVSFREARSVIVAWLLRCGCGDVGCSKITTAKEKRLSQRITALLTQRIPSEQRWGLTAHKLTGITDLRTFMVYCKFPQQ